MTPLHARFTAATVVEAIQQGAAHRRRVLEALRACAPERHPSTLLPWTMEDLPGTIWRCVWTMGREIVQAIEANRFDKMGPDPDPWTRGMFSIGLWRGERFCIEHWIRVDHLAPQVQVDFAVERVAYCRRERAATLQSFQDPQRAGSASYQEIRLRGIEDQLSTARHELTTLAGRLGLALPGHVDNVGIQPGEQMALL